MEEMITAHAKVEREEAEVIARAQRGDGDAFECLYKAHSKHVFSVCLRMLKNTAEAEDLTQQVFLRLFRKIETFRGESCLSTWLHRVAVNAVLMHLRRKRPTDVSIDGLDFLETSHTAPYGPQRADISVRGVLDRVNLTRAIGKLPAGCKRLLLLHDVMGYKHSEIATLIGCSIGGSKSQVHKARKRLRRLLQGEPRRGESSVAPA